MMGANEILSVLETRSPLAAIIEERQVDAAVAQIDGEREFQVFPSHSLQLESGLIEQSSLIEIAHDDREMP